MKKLISPPHFTRLGLALCAVFSVAACTNMGGAVGFGIPVGPYGNIGINLGSNGTVGVSAGVSNSNISANIGSFGILTGATPQATTQAATPAQPAATLPVAPVK